MTATKHTVINKGVGYIRTFTVLDSNNAPVDLTSWSAVFRIRTLNDELASDLLTVNAVMNWNSQLGVVYVELTHVQTAGLPTGKTAWNLDITDSLGKSERLFEGVATIDSGVAG